MSVLFVDGCDHYVSAEIPRKWTANSGGTIVAAGRRTGSKALTLASSSLYVMKQLPAAYTTLVVGCGIMLSPMPGTAIAPIRFRNNGAGQCCLTINANGSIGFVRGLFAGGTTVETSAIGLIQANRWYHIEVKVVFHDSTGTYEVRLNGTDVLSGTGVDTEGDATDGADQIYFGVGENSITVSLDDIFVAEDWQGDCRVDTLMPTGAGTATQWTPNTGANYAAVDDSGDSDDDTTYVADSTAGHIDTYAFGDLEATGGTIKAVAVNVACRKDDAGARTVKGVVDSGATVDSHATAQSVLDAYSVLQFIWETDPDTSAEAFTEATVNGAEFGQEMEA